MRPKGEFLRPSRIERNVKRLGFLLAGILFATSASADDPRAQLAQMEATTSRLRVLLRDIRATRDAKKIACVDDALNRADVTVRSARDTFRAMIDAKMHGEEERARLLAFQIASQKNAVKSASAQADGCASGLDPDLDATVVVVHR